jgi:hypothetical protein
LFPQEPQWLVVERDTHAPEQHPWPAAHEEALQTQAVPALLHTGALPPHEAAAQQTWPPPRAATQLPEAHWPAVEHTSPLVRRGRHAMPSQYCVPGSQLAAHEPPHPSAVAAVRHPEHEGVQQLPPLQTWPPAQAFGQEPQCASLVASSASQPLVASASQSSNPAAQTSAHVSATQAGVEAGPEGHASSHAPQCATSARLCSHPFVASPSQSSKPAWQVKPHSAPAQLAFAWAGATQAFPHSPQWSGLVFVSAQLVPQSVRVSPHPLAHA